MAQFQPHSTITAKKITIAPANVTDTAIDIINPSTGVSTGTISAAGVSTPLGRLDLSSVTPGTTADGIVLKSGTSASPVTSTTANANFVQLYSSTNQDGCRGIYDRIHFTGAGVSGEALRAFSTLDGAGGVGVHGAHISLSFGASGTITGEGAALRATLQLPNTASMGTGTFGAMYSELWADGSTTDPASVQVLAFIRCVMGGDATGIGKIDDKAVFISLEGNTLEAGDLFAAKTSAAVTHTLRISVNGTSYWLMVSNAQ